MLGILAGVYVSMSGALSYTVAGEVNDVSLPFKISANSVKIFAVVSLQIEGSYLHHMRFGVVGA